MSSSVIYFCVPAGKTTHGRIQMWNLCLISQGDDDKSSPNSRPWNVGKAVESGKTSLGVLFKRGACVCVPARQVVVVCSLEQSQRIRIGYWHRDVTHQNVTQQGHIHHDIVKRARAREFNIGWGGGRNLQWKPLAMHKPCARDSCMLTA